MEKGWTGKQTKKDGAHQRYELDKGGSGRIVDFVVEPNLPQGTWTFGEGTVHHCAFQVDDLPTQTDVKAHLEGLGYTDVSDRKDRGYFESVYVRTPGGAYSSDGVEEGGFHHRRAVREPWARPSRCRRCLPTKRPGSCSTWTSSISSSGRALPRASSATEREHHAGRLHL
jgi:hypothetical protein